MSYIVRAYLAGWFCMIAASIYALGMADQDHRERPEREKLRLNPPWVYYSNWGAIGNVGLEIVQQNALLLTGAIDW